MKASDWLGDGMQASDWPKCNAHLFTKETRDLWIRVEPRDWRRRRGQPQWLEDAWPRAVIGQL